MLFKRLGKTPIQLLTYANHAFTVAEFKKIIPFSRAKDIILVDQYLTQLLHPMANQRPVKINPQVDLDIDLNWHDQFNKGQIARILLEKSLLAKGLLEGSYPSTRNIVNYLLNEFGWEMGATFVAAVLEELNYAPINHSSPHLHIFSVIADLMHTSVPYETVYSEVPLICLGVDSLDTLELIREHGLDKQLAIALAQQSQ